MSKFTNDRRQHSRVDVVLKVAYQNPEDLLDDYITDLSEGGIFTQWLQSYEIDTQTVRTVMATVASVFPHVEIWSSQGSDLLFICHLAEPSYSRPHLEKTIATEP